MAALPPPPTDAELAGLLPAGERLVWSGRPEALPAPFWGPRGASAVVGAVFVGLLLAPSFGFLAVPVLAYVAGLGLRRLQMRGTAYGLSAASAVALETFPRRRARVVPLATAAHLRLEPGRGGLGTIHVGDLRFEHVRKPKGALEHARRGFGRPPAAGDDAWREPGPGRLDRVGNGCAGFILLWLMFMILGLVHGPGLMSGGG